MHAQHLHRLWVVGGEGTQAHQGLCDGSTYSARKCAQLLAGVQAATASIDHGLACVAQGLNHSLQLGHLGGRGQAGDVCGDGHGCVPVRHSKLLLDILGHINQHGAWPARACEVESLLHDARQVLDVHDQVVVLSDGARDLHDGRLLEGISADEAAGHLASDGHQGHGIHHGVCQASDQVGSPRTRGGNAHTHAASGLGPTLRRENLTLFMAAQVVLDGWGASQRLVDLHGSPARVGKDLVHPFPLKGLHKNVRTLARFVFIAVHPSACCSRWLGHSNLGRLAHTLNLVQLTGLDCAFVGGQGVGHDAGTPPGGTWSG
mmetsp:Transcript_22279/g.61581  ORF Transcript_22279/g.61581 Transcript_22279/m.61581 type:complete len:318 (-) Transcript_22279:120-1073(-)